MIAGDSPVRRRVGLLVAVLVGLVVWAVAGTPWLPPAAGVAAAVLVRLLGPALPRRLRRPLLAATVAATAVLVTATSVWVWLLLAAGGLVEIVLFHGPTLDTPTRSWGRVLLLAAVLLILGGAVGLTVEHVRAEQREATEWAQASALSRAKLLPPTPGRAARTLLDAITDTDPTVCGLMLSPPAGDQLAAAVGAADCAGALRQLSGQVVEPRRYPAPDHDAIPTTLSPDGQSGTADLCAMSWHDLAGILHGTTPPGPAPGPQLGRLELTRVLGQGYQIVRFTPC